MLHYDWLKISSLEPSYHPHLKPLWGEDVNLVAILIKFLGSTIQSYISVR